MKITIERMAPYLPHELSVNLFNRNYTVTGLTHETIFTKEGAVLNYSSNENEIKPILRPLSDNIIREAFIDVYGSKDSITVHTHNKKGNRIIDWYNDNGWDLITAKGTLVICQNYDYCFTEKMRNYLLKNHVDLFGLIKEGLAIDINTL